MAWIHRLVRLVGPATLMVGVLAVTACANTASTTTVATTAVCPSSQTMSLTTITGIVTTIASNALTVKDANGAARVVLTSATTRYTRLQTASVSALTAGTSVQILTQPSQGDAPTTAQTIIVQPDASPQEQSSSGLSQGILGLRAGSGATTARCQLLAHATGFRGLSGTIKTYDATNQQLVVTDSQGTPFLIAITATTTIDANDQSSQAEVQIGTTVSIRGTTTNSGVMAGTIQILAAGQGQ